MAPPVPKCNDCDTPRPAMIKVLIFDLGHTILDEERDREIDILVRPAFPMPGVTEVIPRISLPMGIWANTTAATADDVKQWLRRASLDQYFSYVVTSTDIGYRKPDRRFFTRALAECGCIANEVLFVGNQLNSDIAGANACGIPSVLLTGPAYRSGDDGEAIAEPTHNIKSLNELPDLLTKIGVSLAR